MEPKNIFRIEIPRNVQKYIKRQDSSFKERLNIVLHELSINPYNNDGELSGHKGLFKKRFGKYRLLFEIHQNILTVTVVGLDSRGQVYNRL